MKSNKSSCNESLFYFLVFLTIVLICLIIYYFVINKSGNNEHSKYITDSVWTRLGYAFLAIFFGLIHFYPQLTFHVRYYDKLAAIGAFLRTVTNLRYISLIGVLFLLAYYILGTIPKFTEKGLVNKLQLVSRAMLVVYYGITVALLG